MDLELRCPSCKEYYRSPVYLPCTHSLCYTCALTSIQTTTTTNEHHSTLDISSTSFASDLDKLSLTSDNDSGVITNRHSPSSSSSSSSSSISSSSRPSSLLLPPALPEISSSFLPTTPTRHQTTITNKTYSTCLQCPVCSKFIYMDISGIKSLPKNRLLADIIDRYHGEKSFEQQAPKCQLCRPSEERTITRICEQCRVGYCDQCCEQYHPMRGPYSKHIFLDPIQQYHNSNEKTFCHEHSNRLAHSYCLHCRLECCQQCSIHTNHDIIPIQQAAKLYKVK
jgi:tripartite motif-containing protein 9/67